MIDIGKSKIVGFEDAIRGMRNPLNSWDQIDSGQKDGVFELGPNDHKLMRQLAAWGSAHAKYRRMIMVYADITAPLYWWKEFDTYKVGTVVNSCSTMHKIAAKKFTLEDFSHDHLAKEAVEIPGIESTAEKIKWSPMDYCQLTCSILNYYREKYIRAKETGADPRIQKKYWWQMIQLLPSSYNQKRTVMLNYEVLSDIYKSRRNHKLDEWVLFCNWIQTLPYSDLIVVNR